MDQQQCCKGQLGLGFSLSIRMISLTCVATSEEAEWVRTRNQGREESARQGLNLDSASKTMILVNGYDFFKP